MLPMIFMKSGVVLGTFMIIFAAIACYWSHYMLTQRAGFHGIKTYPELAERAGGKFLKVLLILSILS